VFHLSTQRNKNTSSEGGVSWNVADGAKKPGLMVYAETNCLQALKKKKAG
jgi:hypothetical protein